ncbi:MAG: hypothetical protein ACK40T_02610 [Akkermansiaceae bacterium]|jgi:uncharacterized membrane protein YccC
MKKTKERLTDLIRSTFLGFIIASIVIIIVPEVKNEIMLMYMALAGKNGVEAAMKKQ